MVNGLIILFFWPCLLFILFVEYDRWKYRKVRKVKHIQLLNALEAVFVLLMFWKGIPMYLAALQIRIFQSVDLVGAYIGFWMTCLKYIIFPLTIIMAFLVVVAFVWSWFIRQPQDSDRLFF